MSGRPIPKTWTCKRRTCKAKNVPQAKKCRTCGAARPPKRIPKHRAVLLELDYDAFVTLNGGEFCGICLKQRAEKDRRLQRDHDHRSGDARGLLCFRCNAALPYWVTPEWLRAAADYLERTKLRAAA